jgi:hypothetical protein
MPTAKQRIQVYRQGDGVIGFGAVFLAAGMFGWVGFKRRNSLPVAIA